MPPAILWGSPLPPVRSGVSDYAVELMPHLAARARVRVLSPPGWTPEIPSPLPPRAELVATETAAADDEVTLIHLGNNPHHLWLLPRLGRPRTVVVLHDTVLHHLLVESTTAAGDSEGYRRRISAAYPGSGEVLAQAREVGNGGRLDPFLFPARRCFLEGVGGVVVHSQRARLEVEAEHLGIPVRAVGLPVSDPGFVDVVEARRRLDLPPDAVILMHLGFLTPEKGVTEILAGLAAARATGVPAHLAIVGEGGFSRRLEQAACSLGLSEHVSFAGWVDEETLRVAPAAADLGIVLRTPSAGETSAAALRFLAAGTPVAVTGRRQFLEWSELAAPRLTPGPSSAGELARLLLEAAANGGTWRARGRAAREVYEQRHRPKLGAAELVRALDEIASSWSG